MTEMHRVWERIKDRAEAHATGKALLSMVDAQRIVVDAFGEECLEGPPNAVVDFFARELVRLTSSMHSRAMGR